MDAAGNWLWQMLESRCGGSAPITSTSGKIHGIVYDNDPELGGLRQGRWCSKRLIRQETRKGAIRWIYRPQGAGFSSTDARARLSVRYRCRCR